MHSIIQMQIAAGLPLKHPGQGSSIAQDSSTAHALFTSDQLDEFGTGQISKCFGPDFARYDGHRIPRIPNGDLKMMSRVRSIKGTRGNFSPHPALWSTMMSRRMPGICRKAYIPIYPIHCIWRLPSSPAAFFRLIWIPMPWFLTRPISSAIWTAVPRFWKGWTCAGGRSPLMRG